MRFVRRLAREAWALAWRGNEVAPPELSIVFVDDAEMARLNETYVHHQGPTDVITFQHGEIVISTERAKAQAKDYRRPSHEELARYIVHGLLHLAGYDDTRPALRRLMHRRQETVLGELRKTLDLRRVLR